MSSDSDKLYDTAINALGRWHYAEVKGWADQFDKLLEDGEFTSQEEFQERFDQDTDGAHVVIYTGPSQAFLLVSRNSDAYVDDFGEEGIVQGGGINWGALTLMALRADIREMMQNDPSDEEWYDGSRKRKATRRKRR